MYCAATASVFLLTLMIYMHLLYFRCTVYIMCIYFKVAYLLKKMTWRCLFPATGLIWAEDLAFYNNSLWALWIYNIHTKISQLLSLSQPLVCLSLPLRISLCTDFSCMCICFRQDLSLICKLSAIAAHYVDVYIYGKQLQKEVLNNIKHSH